MQKEAEAMNAELLSENADLEEILSATLEVDDYVDLESLRKSADHPPFDPKGLDKYLPPPDWIAPPIQPEFIAPEEPRGLKRLVGGNKRFQKALAKANAAHMRAISKWEKESARVESEREKAAIENEEEKKEREAALSNLKSEYERDCKSREAEVAAQNLRLDDFVRDLGYGVASAVSEYVDIVLQNSEYPECFSVEASGEFDSANGEVTVTAIVPGPERLSDVKAYRYNKSADEIVPSCLSQKAQKDRYASAVWQVALRTLHEVFEADRRALIRSISLVVGTEAISPASGNREFVPFVGVGAERESFLEINLSRVVPLETLRHLGASLSRNPLGLEPAKLSGIR
jgi:restriction system protein